MLKFFQKHRKLVILILIVLLIRLASLNPYWIENYYTYGVYPIVSRFLRLLLGWVPFSVGDFLYAAAIAYLLVKLVKYASLLIKKQLKKAVLLSALSKTLVVILSVYILFNVLWGLNYDRKGIAYQLGLDVQPYTKDDLIRLTTVLQNRMNYYGSQVDSVKRLQLN